MGKGKRLRLERQRRQEQQKHRQQNECHQAKGREMHAEWQREPGKGFFERDWQGDSSALAPQVFEPEMPLAYDDCGMPIKMTVHVLSGDPEEAMMEFKQRVFQCWLDDPDPRLEYQTPRQAAATVEGRMAVERVLAELVEHDQKLSRCQQEWFDFTPLRVELGLEPAPS